MSYLLLTSGIAALTLTAYLVSRRVGWFRSTATLMGMAVLTALTSLPAMASTDIAALGVQGDTLEPRQEQFEEDLKLTPTKAQYSGIEYAKASANDDQPISDAQIREKITSSISDELTVNVASGSVILSGTVKNQSKARKIIDQVKGIPGVHEITFELGLEEQASS